VRDPRFSEIRGPRLDDPQIVELEQRLTLKGRLIAEGPVDAVALNAACDSLGPSPIEWNAFHDSFVLAARGTTARQAAWAAAIRGLMVAAPKAPSEEAEGAARDWEEETEPFSVWTARPVHHAFPDGLVHWLQLLMRVSPADGMKALDTLPYPALMSDVLALGICEDRELVEELIRCAPPAFDEHGSWSARSVAALLATALVEQHASRLHGSQERRVRMESRSELVAAHVAALKVVEDDELPTWLARAFGLVLERSDGRVILLGYLSHLGAIRMAGASPQPPRKHDWTAKAVSLVSVARALRGNISVREARDTWKRVEKRSAQKDAARRGKRTVGRRGDARRSDRDGDGARSLHSYGLPFLYGMAVVLGEVGEAQKSDGDVVDLWAWADELFEGRDPGITLVLRGESITEVPQRLGHLLSLQPDPGELLRRTYTKLEPQRRRALFAHRYDELYPDLESVVVLRIGLSATVNWCDRLRKEGVADTVTRDLFFWLYEAARRLWLTAVLDTGDSKEHLVTSCFAYMPFLFRDDLAGAIAWAIPPVASNPRLLATACANLHSNGVDVAKLQEMIARVGFDLRGTLDDVREWSELTQRAEEYPDHLRRLSEALGDRSTGGDE
jgi:hypothetical protein